MGAQLHEKIKLYNNNFKMSESDIQRIDVMDTGNPLILDIHSLDEAYRLHNKNSFNKGGN